MFSTVGRINRAPYFWHTFLDGFVVALLSIGVLVVFEALNPSTGDSETAVSTVQSVLVLGILLLGGVAEICITVRRLHDLGRSGWHYWLFMIPLYNLYLGCVLLFSQGQRGPNEYGGDPLSITV